MKLLKNFLLNLITGANVFTIVLMLAVGFSDRINPAHYPLLGCLGILMPFFIAANLLFVVIWVVVKWKRLWVPLVGFALAYVPIRTYIPLHFNGAEPPEGSIKVVTYNVAGFNFIKDGSAVDSVCAYLQREQPDIVCLQEDMNPRHNPLERLKAIFAYNDTVHVNSADNIYINAVGIHTRFPIIRHERISYDSPYNGSAAFFLLVDGDTVVVVNNHLESNHLTASDRQRYKEVLKGDMERDSMRQETSLLLHKIASHTAERAPQADAVHRYIDSLAGRYPIIACGDFNDTPISYVRRTVAQGLTDCFIETGTGIGLSYNQKGFFFRIDHLLCSSHFTPYACKVDDKIGASDHYPVVCSLKMVDKP